MNENIVPYLEYAIQQGYPKKIKWIIDMFTYIAEDPYEDEYISIKNKVFYGKTEKGLVLLSDKYNEPLLKVNTKIRIPRGFLPNLHKDIETTVGRVIMNYLLLVIPFGNKIDYINKKFSISDIEDLIPAKLTDNSSEYDEKHILVEEYIKFVDMVTFIKNFNKIDSISATENTIRKPPGIDEYKKKLIEEYKKKYGEHVLTKKHIVAEIEDKIKDYINDYIKKDPSYGKFLTGKIIGANKKMFGSYGLGMEFNPSPNAKYISKSLYDGYDKDPNELTTLFNDAILGSYSRAVETVKGGVTAKISLRATNDIEVKQTDCGTKLYLPVTVAKSNSKNLVGRFMIDNNGNTLEITYDNIDSLIGKTIKLRSPMFCKLEHHYCKHCMTKEMANRPTAISLFITTMAGIILNESMKAMHNTTTELAEINDDDLFT